MSMSEFEEGFLSEDASKSLDQNLFSACNKAFPDDFTPEDAVFAQEINELFSVDQEEMPPLFVQTLLAADDTRFQTVDDAFEKKTQARVFRRLQLKRRLYAYPRFKLNLFATGSLFFALPRSLMAVTMACILFMAVTVVMSGPAFATGWTYLWSGEHSGVVQVHSYPSVTPATQAAPIQEEHQKQISIMEAQSLLRFPLFWPQDIPQRYTQNNLYLYDGNQEWADGPVMVLNFTYTSPNAPPRQITICEFKPHGKVLQVAKEGAAHRIKIGGDGSSAVYVEGQWRQEDTEDTPSWVYTDRSELIYEDKKTGVVFWIVGDKGDGLDSEALGKIALSLQLFELNPENTHMGGRLNRVTQAASGMPWIFANDVLYLDDPNNPDGPSFRLVDVKTNTARSSPHMKPF